MFELVPLARGFGGHRHNALGRLLRQTQTPRGSEKEIERERMKNKCEREKDGMKKCVCVIMSVCLF